jgi:hypothetical protein
LGGDFGLIIGDRGRLCASAGFAPGTTFSDQLVERPKLFYADSTSLNAIASTVAFRGQMLDVNRAMVLAYSDDGGRDGGMPAGRRTAPDFPETILSESGCHGLTGDLSPDR